MQSVGTLFSPPRPFGNPDGAGPAFIVVIARDLLAGELDAVLPGGLFVVSAWREPTPFTRSARPTAFKAEAV